MSESQSDSERIREILKRVPDAPPKAIQVELEAQGITVSKNLIKKVRLDLRRTQEAIRKHEQLRLTPRTIIRKTSTPTTELDLGTGGRGDVFGKGGKTPSKSDDVDQDKRRGSVTFTSCDRQLSARLDEKISSAEPEYRILQFVREHGRFFTMTDAPAPAQDGDLQECFGNAQKLSAENAELRYCEGYALVRKRDGQFAAVRHAWCCDTDDTAVDSTPLRDDAQVVALLGVSFSSEIVEHILTKYDMGKVIDQTTIDELDHMLGK